MEDRGIRERIRSRKEEGEVEEEMREVVEVTEVGNQGEGREEVEP